ncbi:STAS domain-containing protein [Streptomyces sp. NBC_01190]|uniref:STAS domain-containing protein n=1 Tax=Streptomyces sp. NBC_01190 TaxID=2903767 RepID=UPI003864D805|nr:STAS domain-containing protein [Streptomyces sp. NBC_01190]
MTPPSLPSLPSPPGLPSPPRPPRAASLLHVHRRDTKNRALITFTGEIDMSSAHLVRESLARCRRDGIGVIDVDMSKVTFCDCSGLNAFLEASTLSYAAGGFLRLQGPGPLTARLFQLTGSALLLSRSPDYQRPAAGPARSPVRQRESPAAQRCAGPGDPNSPKEGAHHG